MKASADASIIIDLPKDVEPNTAREEEILENLCSNRGFR